MLQIILVIFAGTLIWEGAKGFGKTGIKWGITKAGAKPVKGTKGKVIGSCAIAIGLILILFGIVILPAIMGL